MTAKSYPRHVAIIMDGNGRWASRRGRPRFFGHIRGSNRIKGIVKAAKNYGVEALTLYAFSTENWNRPSGELEVLWKLLKKFIRRELEELDRENVRLNVIGEIDRLSDDVRSVLIPAIERLSKNSGMILSFAVSYGARRELQNAAARFANDCVTGNAKVTDMNEDLFADYLWTANLGSLRDVDLVIRTSGEIRVSNFLLWQSAYAEYYFTDICWPDFRENEFEAAMASYAGRNRRFGKVSGMPEEPRRLDDKPAIDEN